MNPSTVFYVHWEAKQSLWIGTTPDAPNVTSSDPSPAAALAGIRLLTEV